MLTSQLPMIPACLQVVDNYAGQSFRLLALGGGRPHWIDSHELGNNDPTADGVKGWIP